MNKFCTKIFITIFLIFYSITLFSQTRTLFVDSSAGLFHISAIAFDHNGNLYAANQFLNGTASISKITPDGTVSTFVPPLPVILISPDAMTFDANNNLFIADSWTDKIIKVTPNGTVSTFVSSGIHFPDGLVIDNIGNLFVSNGSSYFSFYISKITPDGTVSTFCSTNLNYPGQLAIDQSNNIYVSNAANGYNGFITKIRPSASSYIFNNHYTSYAGLAINTFGNIYLSGPTAGEIIILNPDNTFNNTVPYTFDNPLNFTFDASNNLFVADYNDNTISKIVQGTLPLTLTSFTAIFLNKNVQIKWNTTSEVNTNKFIVQYSNDSKTFYDIGEVKAISLGTNYYSFTDDHEHVNGINYYRLKTIDIDNHFTISKVIKLDIKKNVFTITPNPATNFTTLKFAGIVTSNAEIIIFTSAGKKMIQTILKNNIDNYHLDIQSLQPGSYIVELKVNNTKFVQKLIVTK